MTSNDKQIRERIDRKVSDPREGLYDTLLSGPSKGSWTDQLDSIKYEIPTTVPFRDLRRRSHLYCVAHGEIYMATVNRNYNTNTDNDRLFYKFNPVTETVTRLEDLPRDFNNNSYMRYDTVGDVIIAFEQGTDNYYTYYIESDSWGDNESLPNHSNGVENGDYDYMSPFIYEDWVYFFGGRRNQRAHRNFITRNIRDNTAISGHRDSNWQILDDDNGNRPTGIWTNSSEHNNSVEGYYTARISESEALCIEMSHYAQVLKYDMDAQDWKQAPNMPQHYYPREGRGRVKPLLEWPRNNPVYSYGYNNSRDHNFFMLSFEDPDTTENSNWISDQSRRYPVVNDSYGDLAYDESTETVAYAPARTRSSGYSSYFDLYDAYEEEWSLLSSTYRSERTEFSYYDGRMYMLTNSQQRKRYEYYDVEQDQGYVIDEDRDGLESRYEIRGRHTQEVLDDGNGNTYVYAVGGEDQSNGETIGLNVDTWDLESFRDYPFRVERHMSASHNNKMYVIGGYDENNNDRVSDHYQYVPETDTWSSLPNLPDVPNEVGSSRRTDAACGISEDQNGNAYVMVAGGRSDDGVQDSVWAYDITNESWSQRADLPDRVRYTEGFGYNGSFYVIGGDLSSTGNYGNNLWKYDYDADAWEEMESWVPTTEGRNPIGIRYPTVGVDTDRGFMHLFDGDTDGGKLDAHLLYDIEADEWKTNKQMPVEANEISMGATDGYVVLTGGNWRDRDSPYVYDIEANEWNEITGEWDANNNSHRGSYAVGIDGDVYWFGDENGDDNTYKYTPSTDTYHGRVDNMNRYRQYPSGAVDYDNKYIYAVGSDSNRNGDRYIEQFDVEQEQWVEEWRIPIRVEQRCAAFVRDGLLWFGFEGRDLNGGWMTLDPETGSFEVRPEGAARKYYSDRTGSTYSPLLDRAFVGGGNKRGGQDSNQSHGVWEYNDDERRWYWLTDIESDSRLRYEQRERFIENERDMFEGLEHSLIMLANFNDYGAMIYFPRPAEKSITVDSAGEVILFSDDDEAAIRINGEASLYQAHEPVPVHEGDTIEYYATDEDAELVMTQ